MKSNLLFFCSPTFIKSFFLCIGILWSWQTYSQCTHPDVLLSETFEDVVVTGANSAVIYGNGSSNHNGAYIMSGTRFGWFNVRNGIGNVDVYDRAVSGLCVDSMVQVTFWSRQSFGTTNVSFNMVDDLGNILATSTVNLTNAYQQYTFNFTATTPGMRFVIHCNSTGGNGVDIVVEDLLITHCCTTLLPLKLKHFEAECLKNQVALAWKMEVDASNEQNEFVIQRSKDGFSFEDVGTAKALTSNGQTLSYHWVDGNPLPAMTYYRLAYQQSDGSWVYSNIIAIYCELTQDIRVSPNPFQDVFTVYLPFEMTFPCKIEVWDYTGRKIHQTEVQQESQYVEIFLGSMFPNGTYFVKVANASTYSIHKVMKVE